MTEASALKSPIPVFPPPLAEKGLICAFSSRPFQNMSLHHGDTRHSLKNREHFLGSMGVDYRDLVCGQQVHSDHIRRVTEEDRGRGALSHETSLPETDALITDKKNLPLAIFTADCLSVFLYDPLTPAIGLVHAGWRGCKENISGKTVAYMRQAFQTRPGCLRAGFGPAIRDCCYEVGPDFQNCFPEGLLERGGRTFLDLSAVNRRQLMNAGVLPEHITSADLCTSCRNDLLFSFRREGPGCGRLMSVIMLL